MDRRRYLAALGAGLATGVAGCTSTPDSTTTRTQTQDPTTTQTETTSTTRPTTTRTTTALTTESTLLQAPSVTAPRDEKIPWIQTRVENTTGVPHGLLELEHRLYTSDDSILETRRSFTYYIPGGETWRDYTRYYTDQPDRVDHVTTRVSQQTPRVTAPVVEGVEAVSSTLDYTPEGGVDVALEFNIDSSPPDRLTVILLCYDSEGRYRGAIRAVEPNPERSVAVSSGWIGYRTPPDREDEYVSGFTFKVFAGVM